MASMASRKRKLESDDELDEEEPPKKARVQITLDPDDHALQVFANLPVWNRPVEKTTQVM